MRVPRSTGFHWKLEITPPFFYVLAEQSLSWVTSALKHRLKLGIWDTISECVNHNTIAPPTGSDGCLANSLSVEGWFLLGFALEVYPILPNLGILTATNSVLRRMVGVKSRLTQDEEEQLQHLLESRCLSLLYKASIHGYNASIFHAKCDAQGPTVAVAYNGSGYVFGGFTSKEGVLSPLKIPVKTATSAIYDHSPSGPNFGGGALQLLDQNTAAAATSSNNNYTFNVADLLGNDLGLLECEVYRVEDISSFLESPWRKITWTAEFATNSSLLFRMKSKMVATWLLPSLSETNMVPSTFRELVGRFVLCCLTFARDVSTGLTQLKMEEMASLCDTMGIEENSGFNPAATPHPDSPGYIKMPALKDQIHCVAFVIDGCKIEILPEKLEEKLKQLRRKVNQFEIPQLVLLTKVDEICPTIEEDVQCVYKSKAVEKQMRITAEKLGIPLAQIVPVKNYCSELDLSCDVDILLLSAVRQLIHLAESYLDNFPFEKSKKEL
nr:interferon-induced protein 44-like [Chrysemys picta bellii]